MTAVVACGVTSRGVSPVPPVVTISAWSTRAGPQRGLDRGAVVADEGTIHDEPERPQARLEGVSRGVLADARRRTVARGQDEGRATGSVAHQDRFRFVPIRPADRSPGRGRGRAAPEPASPARPSWRSHVPLLPPVLEMSRTARISTPRSTPLTMS